MNKLRSLLLSITRYGNFYLRSYLLGEPEIPAQQPAGQLPTHLTKIIRGEAQGFSGGIFSENPCGPHPTLLV